MSNEIKILPKLETERLSIKLLSLEQLKLWVSNISILEKELDCKCDIGPIDDWFMNIINGQINKIENDPKNYMYHSFWFIIRKSDKKVVGSMDYKNIPNELGEVEIGYGLGAEYEHNGYMTEAIKAFCEMTLKDEKIKTVIAETEIENISSQKVLEKCGFRKYKEEEAIWWKL